MSQQDDTKDLEETLYAPGTEDYDDTNDNSMWPLEDDEDYEDDDEDLYTERGPKKCCFCFPWDPFHFAHAIVSTIVAVLGLVNGFYWTIRGFQEVFKSDATLPLRTLMFGPIMMWTNMPICIGAWFYIRYLVWRKQHPELIESLVDAHYFFVIHFFAMGLWGCIGGIIFFNYMISGYFGIFGLTGSDEVPVNETVYESSAIIAGVGMAWNILFYFITEKFARPWPSLYSYKYD